MPNRNVLRVATVAALLVPALAAALAPPPAGGALAPLAHALRPVVPAVDETEQARLKASHPGVAALAAEARGDWKVDFDVANGRLRRAFGTGIPLLPGPANDLYGAAEPATLFELDGIGRSFIARHMSLFDVDLAEWTAAPEASSSLDGGRVRTLVLRRSIGGVPVEGSAILLAVNRGNLTYLNAVGMDPVLESPAPSLDEAATWGAVARAAASIGATLDGAAIVGKPDVAFVAVQAAPGASVVYRLVRRHAFRLPAGRETWRATVDAHTGELLALEDTNRYACSLDPAQLAGRVRGGVRPAMATDAEVVRELPYPLVTDSGSPVNGDQGGNYPWSGGAASCDLQGTFFRVACSGCTGQPHIASNGDGVLDFGTGGADATWNGKSTPADRTAYYHETIIRALAAKWTPHAWFQSDVRINTNLNQTCNAFWDGAALNFFQSGGGCNNTGEIRDVMQHEWGHGLDQNDGVAPADGATGEAYADHMALFSDHDSCIGPSFWQGAANVGPYCLANPGCAATASCTGVRNIDEKRSTDGLMSMASAPGKCSTSTACFGPLGLECHCEGEIWGEADFHLAYNLLTGKAYDTGAALPGANPAYSDTAAWYVFEHLFFNANGILASYAPSNRQTAGTGAYDAYMVVDDDDGNLANGTPDAAYVNQAYSHHGIAEPTLIGDSANCTPPADPVLTVQALLDPASGAPEVQLTWPDVNAASYEVWRNLKRTDGWVRVRPPVTDDNSPSYVVADPTVQIGETYNYVVVAVSAKGCPSAGAGIRTVAPVVLPDAAALLGPVTDPPPGGDGDGIPEPGEAVNVRVDLKEVAGLAGLTNATVTLSTSDPLAQVVKAGPIAYGNVPPLGTVNGPDTFRVAIALAHGCGTTVPLVAAIAADNGCLLRGFSLVVPSAGCAPATRGEADPVSLSLTGDTLNPNCTDNDGFPDNGETVSLTVGVKNQGTAPVTNVRVTLTSDNPHVQVTSTNPVAIASLAAAAATNATFQFVPAGAACAEPARLTATVDSTENAFATSLSLPITLEEDRTPAVLNTGFETDFGGWTSVGFVRQTSRRNAGTYAAFAGPTPQPHACDQSADGAGACMTLTSPPFVPAAGSQLTFANWYRLEPLSTGQYWDRANVHVIEGATHTLVTPTAGKAYVGATGDFTSLCHIDGENGWAGNAAAGARWGTSTFNLAPWAGKEVQVEINYNTDDLGVCEGFYVDDIQVTNATFRSCDKLVCSGPSCPATPLVVRGLAGLKKGADAVFSWIAEASAAGGYRLYRTDTKTLIPIAHVGTAGVTLAASTAPLSTATTATDAGALAGPPANTALLHYQVIAVCGDGATEGPN